MITCAVPYASRSTWLLCTGKHIWQGTRQMRSRCDALNQDNCRLLLSACPAATVHDRGASLCAVLHADTAGMLFSTAYTASIPCYPAAASQAMETPTGCCLLPLHLLLGVTLVALRCLAACWIDVRQLSLEICRSCKQQLRDLWKPATPACNGILIRWGMQLIIGSCSGCQQRAVRQVQCSACQPICLVLQEARGQSKVVLALEDEQQLLQLKQKARAAGRLVSSSVQRRFGTACRPCQRQRAKAL